MKEIPKTVIRRDGDEITVSLPDRTIVHAKSREHAERIAANWLAPGTSPDRIGVGMRYHVVERIGFDDEEEPK